MRAEVKRAKLEAEKFDALLREQIASYEKMQKLWGEFNPELVKIKDVHLSIKKIAGVKTPVLEKVDFEIKPFSIFNNPGWFYEGVKILEQLATTSIQSEFLYRKMMLLDFARKKTTQKVNLYEKVQIPGYQEAITKIKRFMEDEENLSKSSQKIVKNRQQMEEEAV